MRIISDLDGTLCSDTQGVYDAALPNTEAIARLNNYHDAGHVIIVWTARGTVTGKDWRELTERQLRAWCVKFHHLWFGKPQYDYWFDDKARQKVQALD